MAPARRSRAQPPTKATSDPPPDPVELEESDLPSLEFKKPISWQAGKPIAEGELVKRLTALFKELEAILDENTFNIESVRPVATDLVAERLVKHRNKGVQAFTAACLVEMLRIFAPNAPYTAKELKACLMFVSACFNCLIVRRKYFPCS